MFRDYPEEEGMGVQTDLKAGWDCYKCGLEIEVELELEIEITLFGCRRKHRGC
jgi:hypothetical protein